MGLGIFHGCGAWVTALARQPVAARSSSAEESTVQAKPPFRADQVGSLLRPESLAQLRARFKRGEVDAAHAACSRGPRRA